MFRTRKPAIALLTLAALTLSACSKVDDPSAKTSDSESAGKGDYVNVAKLTGIAWFDRMNTGVEEYAEESGNTAIQVGPATASTEEQVSIIQGLIAKKPAALAVVPLDPNAVSGVLNQARKAGITVVTHEAPSLQGVDADLEAFDNASYGESIMTDMAKCMDSEGEYVQFVGSLTSETHMDWVKAALALQKKEFPQMKRVGDPVESNDNADTAYEKTKQLLQANPEIKGISGASSQDVPGIARAVEEAGLSEDVCVYGTGVPSETKKYVDSGAIDAIYLWDPAAVGRAMLVAAQKLNDGEKLTSGTDLGVEGYTSLKQSPKNPQVFFGDAQLTLTKDTIGDYDF